MQLQHTVDRPSRSFVSRSAHGARRCAPHPPAPLGLSNPLRGWPLCRAVPHAAAMLCALFAPDGAIKGDTMTDCIDGRCSFTAAGLFGVTGASHAHAHLARTASAIAPVVLLGSFTCAPPSGFEAIVRIDPAHAQVRFAG